MSVDEEPRGVIEVDFKPKDGDVDPALRVKRRQFDDCNHLRQLIVEAERIVECRDCKAVLDPIAVMLNWARDWGRYADSVSLLREEQKRLRASLAALLRRERNTKARLRRLTTQGADR